jgi:hypothetical protein
MDAQETRDKAIELYRLGWGYTKISKELYVSRTAIRRLLEKSGEKTAAKNAKPLSSHVDLDLSLIRRDGDTQMRVSLVWDTIRDYADEMLTGADFPPVTVFFDGAEYWLSDGFHRVAAAIAAERKSISANVYEGTARDARRHAMSANASHGLRRTNTDKRNAVEMALADEEWSQWPNTRIAEMCAVAESFVRKIKQERESHSATAEVQAFPSADQAAEPKSPTVAPASREPEGVTSNRRIDAPLVEPSTGAAKGKPYFWGFKFDRAKKCLSVTNTNNEITFKNSAELKSFISLLEAKVALWGDDDDQ